MLQVFSISLIPIPHATVPSLEVVDVVTVQFSPQLPTAHVRHGLNFEPRCHQEQKI